MIDGIAPRPPLTHERYSTERDAQQPLQSGATEWGETVGVGPWPGPWPDDPRYDPELLREGDRRNVVDAYR